MYMINCYNVSESEWYDSDTEVEIILALDIENKEEAEAKAEELRKEFKYIQVVKD